MAIHVTARMLAAYDHFLARGMTEKGAAAPVGNFVQESGESLDSTMFRAHPDASGGVPQALKSGGIAEWLGSRKTDYIRFSRELAARKGFDQDVFLNDLATQCDFVIHELEDPRYATLYQELTTDTGRSIATLTANFCWVYERPAKATAGLDNRIAHAEAVYERAQLIKAAQETHADAAERSVDPPVIVTTPWIPQSQVVVNPMPSQTTTSVITPPQAAPAGPPMSASTAGRQAAVRDMLDAMRANYLAERASIDVEISIIDATILDFERLGPVPAIHAPIVAAYVLQKSAEPSAVTRPQRKQSMFGKSWVTSLFGVGSIGGALVTILVDLANKQMPDSATIGVLISAVSAGVGLLNAKDKNVTGGTISAVTGKELERPVSLIDTSAGRPK